MTTRDVYIRQYDWMLHLFLDVNPEYLYEVVTKMDDVAISSHIIRRVALLIKHSEYDYGLTATNSSLRETVMVVGESSSREEFLNTLQHEVRHLVDDIAECDSINPYGEEVGYITGTINTLLAQNIDQYFCKCQE